MLRKPKEIREMFEQSEMKFIMLNNRLFDDFYSQGKVTYKPILIKENGIEYWQDHKGNKYPYSENNHKQGTATFDERDFIILILLKFLSQHNFQGYSQEITDYLNQRQSDGKNKFSDKRLKERLKKLQFLQGNMNNEFIQKEQRRIMVPDGITVRLVNEEKVIGFENGKSKRTFYKWHVNFDCDYKREVKEGKETDTPINFFKVTIYDLDLYINGILNEREFITYLYFIRANNEGKEIWHSIDKLSENLNTKDTSITQKIVERLMNVRVKDKFCGEGEDFPLLHVSYPKNYKQKLMDRQQPSAYYKPKYNISTCSRLIEVNPDPNEQENNTGEDLVDELMNKQKKKAPIWKEDLSETELDNFFS